MNVAKRARQCLMETKFEENVYGLYVFIRF